MVRSSSSHLTNDISHYRLISFNSMLDFSYESAVSTLCFCVCHSISVKQRTRVDSVALVWPWMRFLFGRLPMNCFFFLLRQKENKKRRFLIFEGEPRARLEVNMDSHGQSSSYLTNDISHIDFYPRSKELDHKPTFCFSMNSRVTLVFYK
jgi:hypothetical protein